MISTRDRTSFFNVFLMPPEWMGGMVLCEEMDSSYLELPGPARTVYLGSRVPSMGWCSAVGVAQMAHREIVKLSASPHRELACAASEMPTLPLEFELRKDRPCPISGHCGDSAAWAIYIDDLAEEEVFTVSDLETLEGTASETMRAMDEQYGPEEWNCPGSDAKSIGRASEAKLLGVQTDGLLGRRDTPPGYLLDLNAFNMLVLEESWVERKLLQILAGRWVRVQQRNRATASHFDAIWKAIASGKRWIQITQSIRVELLAAACLTPLYYTDLRLVASAKVSATDSSSFAGGIACSTGLSSAGHAQAEACRTLPHHRASEEFLIASPFDGIGALRQAWSMLGLPCAGYLSWEIDKAGKRVLSDRWQHVEHLGDIRECDLKHLKAMRNKYLKVKVVLLFPGFPCQGISALKQGRKGLRGSASGLFWELPRVKELLAQNWKGVRIIFAGENVVGIELDDCNCVSEFMSSRPLLICSSLFDWASRPRMWWIPWQVYFEMCGYQWVDKGHYLKLTGDFVRPQAMAGERILVAR